MTDAPGGPLAGLPAHAKLLALIGFVLVVVATPTPTRLDGSAAAWTPYGLYALLLAGVLAYGQVPPREVARRALVEVPFLVFAALMPFVAAGPRVQVGPLSLAEAGVLGALALVVKATLGVVAAIVLAATTPARELLLGLERLRLPHVLVAICSFMIRYASVVTLDVQRMRVARESRGAGGGSVGHLAAVAGGAGTLFVRSYERGERVHLAMLARGYDGRMPRLEHLGEAAGRDGARPRPPARSGAVCALLPGAALIVLVASRMMAA